MDVYLDNLLTLFMIGSPFMPFSLFLPAVCWFFPILFDLTLTIPAFCHTMVTGLGFFRKAVTAKKPRRRVVALVVGHELDALQHAFKAADLAAFGVF